MTESHRFQFRIIRRVARGLGSLLDSVFRSRAQLAAENLFLRKELALHLERRVKPRRADDATRMTLVALLRFVDWRRLLTIVNREAGHARALASKGRQVVLALEIERAGPSTDSSGPPRVDRDHGGRESDVLGLDDAFPRHLPESATLSFEAKTLVAPTPSPHCLPDPGRSVSIAEHVTASIKKQQHQQNQTLRPQVRLITAFIENSL
jgi:hypothetical protein